jgi:hypothetical protein
VSSGLTAVDVQGRAGDECGPFAVEDPVDDVLITPGATALTRTPRDANSVASERVTASRPPLVSEARAEGASLLAWSTRLAVMLTMWPLPW